ncbi:hypothetical protein [Arhodomonas sp. SL1]|uniref:hypothetical protein n=1 Tax=Arhodomonas sp. SL1 TaxID=3425691 RepID=UPI003F884E25
MMQQVLDVDVLGIRRVHVDGNTYTKLYLAERVDDGDVKGVIPMTMPADPKLVDQLDATQLPRQHKLRVRLQMAGGGKTGMFALEVLPDDAAGNGGGRSGGTASAAAGSGASASAEAPASRKGA